MQRRLAAQTATVESEARKAMEARVSTEAKKVEQLKTKMVSLTNELEVSENAAAAAKTGAKVALDRVVALETTVKNLEDSLRTARVAASEAEKSASNFGTKLVRLKEDLERAQAAKLAAETTAAVAAQAASEVLSATEALLADEVDKAAKLNNEIDGIRSELKASVDEAAMAKAGAELAAKKNIAYETAAKSLETGLKSASSAAEMAEKSASSLSIEVAQLKIQLGRSLSEGAAEKKTSQMQLQTLTTQVTQLKDILEQTQASKLAAGTRAAVAELQVAQLQDKLEKAAKAASTAVATMRGVQLGQEDFVPGSSNEMAELKTELEKAQAEAAKARAEATAVRREVSASVAKVMREAAAEAEANASADSVPGQLVETDDGSSQLGSKQARLRRRGPGQRFQRALAKVGSKQMIRVAGLIMLASTARALFAAPFGGIY
jgi:chromosome segregation ATPase